jgi:hypothetical protein
MSIKIAGTPAPIIHSTNGRTYDLTQNEIRNDLLPNDVLRALQCWPHGLEIRINGNWIDDGYGHTPSATYRAKPAPQVNEYVLYWEPGMAAYSGSSGMESHRITIRYTSGTLPAGTYTGPDGAEIIVEALK